MKVHLTSSLTGLRTRTNTVLIFMTSLMFTVSTLHYVATWLNAISYKENMQSGFISNWGQFHGEDGTDSAPAIRTAGVAYILQQLLPIINARI